MIDILSSVLVRLELAAIKKIRVPGGELTYNWKTDLLEEEDEDYLPVGYTKVLELATIQVSVPGKGTGDLLMQKFLASAEIKKAHLVFADPTPYFGVNEDSKLSDAKQTAKIQKFLARYGFRHRPKSDRMWLVLKGTIQTKDLP